VLTLGDDVPFAPVLDELDLNSGLIEPRVEHLRLHQAVLFTLLHLLSLNRPSPQGRPLRMLSDAQHGERTLRFEVPHSGRMGGFNLYGARMGAYPVDPTLLVEVEP
jgi:hypothetical protein